MDRLHFGHTSLAVASALCLAGLSKNTCAGRGTDELAALWRHDAVVCLRMILRLAGMPNAESYPQAGMR